MPVNVARWAFQQSAAAVIPYNAYWKNHSKIASNTYRIVEDIHELLEALCFPESDADFPISGKDLQRFQRKMLNDREVRHHQVQNQRDAAGLEHRLTTFVVLQVMRRTQRTVRSKDSYTYFLL